MRQSIWFCPNSCSTRFTVYSSFLKLSHAPGSMVVLPDFQFLKVALGRNRFASFSSRPKTTMIFTSPFSPHYFSPFESKMFSLTVIILSFLSNDPRVGGCGYPAILPLLFPASFLLWPTFFGHKLFEQALFWWGGGLFAFRQGKILSSNSPPMATFLKSANCSLSVVVITTNVWHLFYSPWKPCFDCGQQQAKVVSICCQPALQQPDKVEASGIMKGIWSFGVRP